MIVAKADSQLAMGQSLPSKNSLNLFLYGLQGRRQDFHGGVSKEARAKHARKKIPSHAHFCHTFQLLPTIATIYWHVFRENDPKIIEILQFCDS